MYLKGVNQGLHRRRSFKAVVVGRPLRRPGKELSQSIDSPGQRLTILRYESDYYHVQP
jgi:hypothetical protein